MTNPVQKLLSISSPPLCSDPVRSESLNDGRRCYRQLRNLLDQKNGFYAFESALHVFPSGCDDIMLSLENWNNQVLWKGEFGGLNDMIFFAEDLFGGQFGIEANRVIKFEPETAESEFFASDIDEWSLKILEDYEFETGYPLASEWQKRNGPIKTGNRLLPRVPFVLGGDYIADNLYEIDAVKGMRFRADLWKQTKDLPDGADTEIKVID